MSRVIRYLGERPLSLLALAVVSVVIVSLLAQFYAPALATRVFLLF